MSGVLQRAAPSVAQRLDVDILGGVALRYGASLIAPKTRKANALFLFLLSRAPRPIARADLATMFWPAADERSARSSLRQALFELNRAFGPCALSPLDTAGDAVRVLPEACRLVHRDLAAQLTNAAEIEALAGRMRGRGDICPNLDGIGPEVDAWLDELRGGAMAALEAALSDKCAAPDPALSMAAARYAYALDPFNELALRTLMRGHDAAGESPQAIRLYDAHFEMLEAELGVEPSMDTQAIAVDIKSRAPAEPAPQGGPGSLLAVLPFECLLPGQEGEFIPLAVMFELTCLLATLDTPAVISSNSTRHYPGPQMDPNAFGRELGARFVLTGRVTGAGGRLRVMAELTDTGSARILSARAHEIAQTDIFAALPELAQRIVKQIVPSLHSEELRRIRNWSESSLEANHLFLKAREIMGQIDLSAGHEAERLLRLSLQRDPEHAPSHTQLAENLVLGLQQGWRTDRAAVEDEVVRLTTRACALSSSEGRARALLGHMRLVVRQDAAAAADLIEDALATMPGDAETLIWSVPALAFMGDAPRAVGLGRRAMSLSPLDPSRFRNGHFLAIAQYLAGDYAAAAELGQQSLALDDRYLSNLRLTMAALVGAGQVEAAQALAGRHRRLVPDFDLDTYIGWQAIRQDGPRVLYRAHLAAALGTV